ncbi:MAG: hypothetical protein M1833_000701 [Piccolia ochrophora]|nr:MAG: hypothetical protein M1833_000701 [Piccolia ochrophora]
MAVPLVEQLSERRQVFTILDLDLRTRRWSKTVGRDVFKGTHSMFVTGTESEPPILISTMEDTKDGVTFISLVVSVYPASGNYLHRPSLKPSKQDINTLRVAKQKYSTTWPNKFFFDTETGKGVVSKYWRMIEPLGWYDDEESTSLSTFLNTINVESGGNIPDLPPKEERPTGRTTSDATRWFDALVTYDRYYAWADSWNAMEYANSELPVKLNKVYAVENWKYLHSSKITKKKCHKVTAWDVSNLQKTETSEGPFILPDESGQCRLPNDVGSKAMRIRENQRLSEALGAEYARSD